MTVILANIIVSTLLLTFVFPLNSSFPDKRHWMFDLASSLQEQEVKRNGQMWNMSPFNEDQSTMQMMDQCTVPEIMRLFEMSQNDQRDKKSYPFNGLLCCNHPPTKPPTVKRSSLTAALSRRNQFPNIGVPDHVVADEDSIMLERRGVTEVVKMMTEM